MSHQKQQLVKTDERVMMEVEVEWLKHFTGDGT